MELLAHKGIPYIEMIRTMAEVLAAESYLEIGTAKGASLAAVRCEAVAIDPQLRIQGNAYLVGKRALHLFQMPSDEFFRKYDLHQFLPNGVDLAFLDGLHRCEFLLRDFINTERYCRQNSVILMHDCLPTTEEMASRAMVPHSWTGDVWKVVPILVKYRPGLKVHLLDCPPTGLVAVTNLDPESTVLSDSYFDILQEFTAMSDLREYCAGCKLTETRELSKDVNLTSHFWL